MPVQIREFQSEDAEAVSRMFQASDPAWPGGFDDGLRVPAAALLHYMEQDKPINTYIAWEGEEAVGFADVFDTTEERVAYLGLLNSDPAHHGKGVGRDLIRRIIDRCVELGYKRLDLDTWPGNTRAVPLYKKTGFGWGPESYELQNHMPLLLSHALTKSYFETADWYQHLQRDLRLGHDVERRNGALVFSYCWETESGLLRVLFDQKAKTLSELETPELLLSLETERFEVLQGQEQTVRLRIQNKRDQPRNVTVSASGGDPISVSHFVAAQVAGGASEVVEFKATASDEKTGEGSVKLNVLVDNSPVEMAATVKVRLAIEMSLEPAGIPLRPGRQMEMYLNIQNNLPETADVDLLVTTSPDLEVTLDMKTLTLAAGEVRGLPVFLRSITAGSHTISVTPLVNLGEERETRPSLRVELAAVGPGDVVATRQDNDVVLASEEVVLKVCRKGTSFSLRDRETGQELLSPSVGIGLPFWPSKIDEQEFNLAVESGTSSATVVVSEQLKDPKDLYLDRRIMLRSDGCVTLFVQVTNVGAKERKVLARLRTGLPRSDQASYLPLAEGIVRGQESGQPSWHSEIPEQQPTFSERWMALQWPDWTIGVLWPEGVKVRVGHDDWSRFALTAEQESLQPGESLSLGEITLVPSRAGWQGVQRAWRRSEGFSPSGSQVIPAAGVRLVPSPVLLVADSATATVEARADFARPTRGEVEIESSEHVSAEPRLHSFTDVHTASAGTSSVTLTRRNGAPFAAEVDMLSGLPSARGCYSAPVILLGSTEGRVRVSQEQVAGETVWRVENGWLSFGVRPEVLGIVHSLTTPAGERLYTNFPDPQPRHWDYPVYGGIRPVLWERAPHFADDLGRLKDLHLQAEEVEREGTQNVLWHGMRLGVDLEHDALRGLRFEIEYLTVPGSNVLAAAAQIRSLGPARYVHFKLEVAPANRPEVPVLLFPDQNQVGRGGIHGDWNAVGTRWVSVEYPETGMNTVLIGAATDTVEAYDMGPDGIIVSGTRRVQVPAGGVVLSCHYVVFAEDRNQATIYSSLADLGGV